MTLLLTKRSLTFCDLSSCIISQFFHACTQLTVFPPRPQHHRSARVCRYLLRRSRCCPRRSILRKLHATGVLLLLIFLLQILPLAFWRWIDCTMGNVIIILQDKSDCTPSPVSCVFKATGVGSKITPHAPLMSHCTHPPNQISRMRVSAAHPGHISWSFNKGEKTVTSALLPACMVAWTGCILLLNHKQPQNCSEM